MINGMFFRDQLMGVAARLPFIRRRMPSVSRQDVLSAAPVRNELVLWEEDGEGLVTLKIPRRQDRVGRILSTFFAAPEHRQISLDELGSDVWRLCDGHRSLQQMVTVLADKYKLSRREVELSLSVFLRTLAKRRLVGLLSAPADGGIDAPDEDGRKPSAQRRRERRAQARTADSSH